MELSHPLRPREDEYVLLMSAHALRDMLGAVDDRLRRLPPVYAEFVVLERQGLDDAEIAHRLGVPVESLPLLARLAEAKLARLVEDSVRAAPGEAGIEPSTQATPRQSAAGDDVSDPDSASAT
jgi:DNA-directed RNA polymerase specialized sigma24 family protein